MCAFHLQYIVPSGRALNKLPRYCWLLPILFSAAAWAEPSAAQEAHQISELLVYSVVVFVLVLILFEIATLKASLPNAGWSMADALSEDAEVTFKEKIGDDGWMTPRKS